MKKPDADQLEKGFTMFEVLTTIFIMTLVMGFAVVSMVSLKTTSEKVNAKHEIASDILRARKEALARGTRVIIDIDSSGKSYSVGFDYVPYSDPPVAEAIKFTRSMAEGIMLTPAQKLVFDPRGCLIDDTGALTTGSLVLNHHQLAYAVGSILPTGFIEFD